MSLPFVNSRGLDAPIPMQHCQHVIAIFLMTNGKRLNLSGYVVVDLAALVNLDLDSFVF